MITPSELQKITREAIEEGSRQRQAALAEQARQEQIRQRAEAVKAEGIIAQIPGRALTEARAGRSHAIVMSVGSSDYTRPSTHDNNWNTCKPEWLKGAAKLVFDHCRDSGLKPELQFWHDGVGVNSGFNIVIHW